MSSSSAFETATRRCFTTPEIVELLSPSTTPLSLSSNPPRSPPSSGSLFLYDRSATRNYKQDGYDWVKKPVSFKRGTDRVREDAVRLRYGKHYRVAAYYARLASGGGTMRRRSYFLIDPVTLKPDNDLVLVHYLDTEAVRKRRVDPRPDSRSGHNVKTKGKQDTQTARLVVEGDEDSGSAKGLVETESEEETGNKKTPAAAEDSCRLTDEVSCYEFDDPGTSADTEDASCHWIGQSPNRSILQRTLALGLSSPQHNTPSTVSQLLASPKTTEEDVSNEWLSYSKEEKTVIINDIYGSAVSAENAKDSSSCYARSYFADDPHLSNLTLKISLMNDEISKMHISEKVCYLEALRQCPEVVCSRGFKMHFLRCENSCPRAAAHRLVRYWTKKVEIFGRDDAFLPLTLEGAMADNYEEPGFGHSKLLPGLDPSGRAILLFDNTIPCTRETALRSLWYMVHVALEDDSVRMNGYICVVYRCSPPEEFNRQGKLEQLSLVRDILPLQCRAFHICNWKTGEMCIWFVKAVIAALNFTAGPYMRSRVVFHDGSMEQVSLHLAEYGISLNQLPTKMGGTFTEERFQKWLALRREAGM